MFGFKANNTGAKNINSSEYEECLKRILERDSRVATLASELEALKTELANLRGKFNAKLSKIKQEEQQEQDQKQKQEEIYTSHEIAFG